jgi:hypothetical protein
MSGAIHDYPKLKGYYCCRTVDVRVRTRVNGPAAKGVTITYETLKGF